VENGIFNSIPFPFKRFNNYVPGIIRGQNVITTAGSGIGKTQLTKFLYVYSSYKFYKENTDNMDLKIFYIALEESKEEMMLSLISHYLYDYYKLSIPTMDLQSFNRVSITDKIVGYIQEAEDYFEELLEHLEIVDHIFHPTGIYKHIEDYALKNGKMYFKEAKKVDKNGKMDVIKIPHHYEPNKPNEYVIVIVDHISLMEPEKGNNLHETLSQWSFRYARKKLTKFFKYVVVNVQQQSAESEKQQFDMRGGNIISKLLPSLTNLANNKETQRDAFLILGLFAPYRFQVEEHNGYDITAMEDNFRSLYVLKNRNGPSVTANLYFDGASNSFRELPAANDDFQMQKVYQMINRNNN
jgi:replicative DNA helicase